MNQYVLIGRIVEALVIYDGMVTKNNTPLGLKTLVKDEYRPPAHGQFIYSSVVGMLLYLTGNTRSNIAYAINCCAQKMFELKHLHEL